MSKTRDTGFLGNVVKVDSNGDISLMHGSTMLMQISSSGAVTTTGVISGSNALSSSYALNADQVDGLNSTSFVFTSSYNTDSSSMSTRVSNNESTGSTLTTASASFAVVSSSYSSASGSLSTRVTRIEGNYATTGSNVFLGAQTVCANITSTGTIIAQTLNVQQVTSSIVYSSGSNVFGCSLTNTQQFTGSVLMTGSLTVTTAGTSPEFQVNSGGTIKGNALTDVHQVTGSLRITGSVVGLGSTCIGGLITGCSSILQVPSTTAVIDILRLNNPAVASSGTRLKFENGYGDLAALRVIHRDNGSLADDGQIEFQVASNTVLDTKMTILNTGQIGMGTLSPSAELQINKNCDVTLALSNCVNVTSGNRGSIAWYNCATSTVANIRATAVTDNVGTQLEFYTRPAAGNLTQVLTLDGCGNVAVGGFSTSGTPGADYRSIEVGRQGNTLTGSPFKSAMYISANATITAGSTTFTYRNTGVSGNFGLESDTFFFDNAVSGNTGCNITWRPRFKIGGDGIACFACTVGVGISPSITLGPSGGPNNSIHVHGAAGDAGLLLSTQNCNNGQYLGEIQFGTLGTASTQKKGATIASKLTAASNSTVTGNLEFYTTNAGTETLRMSVASSGLILTCGRMSSILANNGNIQEWVGSTGTIPNNTGWSLFCIQNQYDILSMDIFVFTDVGSFQASKHEAVFGYTNFVTSGVGFGSAFCIFRTGTLYNETMTICNLSGSQINVQRIAVRVWGYGVGQDGSGGSNLLNTSCLTRIK